ncbi:hypothetical protein J2Z69_001887 [Paenibacillus shirakamiensis]|uniref:Uncharacterized protein n=1 Tax=Paenibacillus shirakamiensis TaxID=1265935 RepID=A0ABS4JGK7_9BACL|nr:hypothetical protein [Paenibacillus shirakamiensis]MBP2000856.1 hypothetical protein [Paenibacillus shirakamiensis]
MKRKWTSSEKTMITGGLRLAGIFILTGILLLGMRYNIIRLN